MRPIQLLHWEHEQLIDHIESRSDIWASPRSGMYLRSRSYDDDEACMGLVISTPTTTGPYRQYALRTIAMQWTQPECDEYIRSLCCKWTDYGQRVRYAEFLITEANIPADKAQAIAVGLSSLDYFAELSPDTEDTPIPATRELWPDIADLGIDVRHSERVCRSYALVGGGWLTVRLANGMLRIRCSLRSSGKYGGGYGGAFEGFIRPPDGNCKLAAAFLFGNDVETYPVTANTEGVAAPDAQQLPLASPEEVTDGTANFLDSATAGTGSNAAKRDDEANTSKPVEGTTVPELPS